MHTVSPAEKKRSIFDHLFVVKIEKTFRIDKTIHHAPRAFGLFPPFSDLNTIPSIHLHEVNGHIKLHLMTRDFLTTADSC